MERLVPLGAKLLAPAFEMLAEREVPVEGDEPQILSEPQRDILLATFDKIGRTAVVDAEKTWRLGQEDADTIRTRLWIRGAVGNSEDVDVLIALANESDEEDGDEVEEALRRAITTTLVRDERALERLARMWRGLKEPLVPDVVLAVGASRDPRGVELLLAMLSAVPDLMPTVCSQLRLLGPSPSATVNSTLAQMLRTELDPNTPQTCAAAAIALAALEDAESVPLLVSLLDSESEGIKRNCAWALGELTGMRFPPDAALWRRWVSAEQAWRASEMSGALFRLRSVDPGQVAASIREISNHRLFRHELSGELGKLLESPNSNLRRVACVGLQQLGSRQSVPLLAGVLADPDPDVVRAAQDAMASITGVDASDPEALATLLARIEG